MTMQEQAEALADIREVIERVRDDGNAVQFTLKNGIVLRCKPVPPIYMRKIAEKFIPPPPPKVRIERGDDSYYEDNPNDPDWLREIDDINLRSENALTRLVLGMGTEAVSVPDDKYMPGDDGWVVEVRRADKYTGVETPLDLDDPDLRYLSWLMFYALDNSSDVQIVGLLPSYLAGPSEAETAAAVDAFRDLRERRAHPDGVAPDANSDGSPSESAPAEPGPGVRPTRSRAVRPS